MREDSHYTLGNKLILIIPEESSCDYIRNRKFIQWQSTVLPISTIKSTVLPISTIKSTVLPISTITSHLKVYTVTVNSSTNINNHLSPHWTSKYNILWWKSRDIGQTGTQMWCG
jgi:hypothetical protein